MLHQDCRPMNLQTHTSPPQASSRDPLRPKTRDPFHVRPMRSHPSLGQGSGFKRGHSHPAHQETRRRVECLQPVFSLIRYVTLFITLFTNHHQVECHVVAQACPVIFVQMFRSSMQDHSSSALAKPMPRFMVSLKERNLLLREVFINTSDKHQQKGLATVFGHKNIHPFHRVGLFTLNFCGHET